MSPKYAAVYNSLPSNNDWNLENKKTTAHGSREDSLSGSRDPSPSRGQDTSLRRSQRPFFHPRAASSKPKFKLNDFRRSGYGEPTIAQVHYFDPEAPPHAWSFASLISHSLSGSSPHIFASLRAITAILQLSLLIFLQITYLKLPRTTTGQLPRLNDLYADYPFISCVGSLHLTTYRTLTAISVTLSLTTDSILFHRARHDPIGYYCRWVNLLSSLVAATLLLYLSVSGPSLGVHTSASAAFLSRRTSPEPSKWCGHQDKETSRLRKQQNPSPTLVLSRPHQPAHPLNPPPIPPTRIPPPPSTNTLPPPVRRRLHLNPLHLTLIGLHSLAVLAIKTSNLVRDHLLRLAYPALRTDPTARTIRHWKEATVCLALPLAILLNMGTYACRADTDTQTPGTSCYRVLAIAAPADWLYALVGVNWSVHMGFEAARNEYIDMVLAGCRVMYERVRGGDEDEADAPRATLWDAEYPDFDLGGIPPPALVKELG